MHENCKTGMIVMPAVIMPTKLARGEVGEERR